MQSGIQICNTDAVVELKAFLHSTDGIDPLEVHIKDTISEIKERVCDQVAKQMGNTFACEPELFMMVHFPDSHVLDNDSTKTLGQVLIDRDVKLFSNRVLVVHLCPPGTAFWESSGKKEDYMEYHEGCLDDDVCIYPDEETVGLDPEDAFSVKRPDDDILPADTRTFRVFGKLFANRYTDHGEKKRYIPYEGLTYPLEQVTMLSTPASLVLLVFNSANMDIIEGLALGVDTSDILPLQVSWDKFCYLFLRKLRQDLGAHVPIVAVTDLDVRHLDLLAFLDTAPCNLPKLYGWNLSQDCAHLGVYNNEDVNIKWLGIRPSDSDDASPYHSWFAKPSCKLPHDFKVVYDFLLAHPSFSRKSKRVQELQVIADREVHRSLPYLWQGKHWCHTNTSFVWENYLPTKISNRDWI